MPAIGGGTQTVTVTVPVPGAVGGGKGKAEQQPVPAPPPPSPTAFIFPAGIRQKRRKMARRPADPVGAYSALETHLGNVLDDPADDVAMQALADHLLENYGETPEAVEFARWTANKGTPISPDFLKTMRENRGKGVAHLAAYDINDRNRFFIKPMVRGETAGWGRRWDRPYWEHTVLNPNTGLSSYRQPATGRRRLGGKDVAKGLLSAGGLNNALINVISARMMHPSRPGEVPSSVNEIKFKRGTNPRKVVVVR